MAFSAYLAREFERRRARNPRYSLRAFGRDLGCDHSTLSQWMRGTRPITGPAISRLCDALGLRGIERERACELEPVDLAVLDAARDAHRRTPDVAAATGLAVDVVNQALFRLMRLRLIELHGAAWHVAHEEAM